MVVMADYQIADHFKKPFTKANLASLVNYVWRIIHSHNQ
jgi:hypothetical protein